MPRKVWTPEQKAEASRKAKERYAAQHAAVAVLDRPKVEERQGTEFPSTGVELPPTAPEASASGLAAPTFPVEEKPRPENYEPQGLRKIRGAVRIWPTATSRSGHRTIKMAQPICTECQSQDGGPGWWYRCEAKGHNPYFTDEHYVDKIVEDLGPPDENGDREVIGTKTVKVKSPGGPNLIAVPVTGRHNGDHFTAMRHTRGYGRRRPEEIGLAPFCEFSQTGLTCWSQDDLVTYGDIGTFCCVEQLKAVLVDQRRVEKFLEVLNDEKKARQWSQIAI